MRIQLSKEPTEIVRQVCTLGGMLNVTILGKQLSLASLEAGEKDTVSF